MVLIRVIEKLYAVCIIPSGCLIRLDMGRKSNVLKKFLKFCVVVVSTTGFLLQTIEFMYLYWTYPTVVDIQVSIPSEIELPGISFCNTNGIYPQAVCDLKGLCSQPVMLRFINLCSAYPILCDENGKLPRDFRAIMYHKFMRELQLNATSLGLLRKPMSEYFTCNIISDGQKRDCNIENAIIGSYYSEGFMPSFCFSINTLWSQPGNKILKIKKSERILLKFYIDIVDRDKSAPEDMVQRPKYIYPSNPAVQLAIHSPYHIPSPYMAGQSFMGGKRYAIKLKQDEKHLLPPPYQTNCTDYLSLWKQRGGIGPLNQIMVIQECKYNASLEKLGCVPFSVDYPHNDSICKLCEECNMTEGIWDHCTDLLKSYNQPCDFITFDMRVEEKVVYIEQIFKSNFLRTPEKTILQEMGYNCTHEQILTRRCQTVNLEMVFDDFEITNVTYNPKFERLELFSVVGGYMGMYLGISIVAMYDFAELAVGALYDLMKKRRANDNKKKKLLNVGASENRVFVPFENNRNFQRRTIVHPYRDI